MLQYKYFDFFGKEYKTLSILLLLLTINIIASKIIGFFIIELIFGILYLLGFKTKAYMVYSNRDSFFYCLKVLLILGCCFESGWNLFKKSFNHVKPIQIFLVISIILGLISFVIDIITVFKVDQFDKEKICWGDEKITRNPLDEENGSFSIEYNNDLDSYCQNHSEIKNFLKNRIKSAEDNGEEIDSDFSIEELF